MYQFKKELREQLLKGRTIRFIAHEIEFSEVHLSNILNGKCTCKKSTAYYVIKMLGENNKIEDYFIRIK